MDGARAVERLAMLDKVIDPRLTIYLIMDNGSSHTSRSTRAWLTTRPNTTAWLNMIEMWFSALTRRLLLRGEFTSREDLMAQSDDFTIRYNATARPYRRRHDARVEHDRHLVRHSD